MYSDGHRVVEEQGGPTAGGAHATFVVKNQQTGKNLSALYFQSDTIKAVGVQGWTNETVLAVVAQRLQAFQHGPFPCGENHDALKHVVAALEILEKRTARREAEGTEGEHVESITPADVGELTPEVLDADDAPADDAAETPTEADHAEDRAIADAASSALVADGHLPPPPGTAVPVPEPEPAVRPPEPPPAVDPPDPPETPVDAGLSDADRAADAAAAGAAMSAAHADGLLDGDDGATESEPEPAVVDSDPDDAVTDEDVAVGLELVRAQCNAIQTTSAANQGCNKAIGDVAAALGALQLLGVQVGRATAPAVDVAVVADNLSQIHTALLHLRLTAENASNETAVDVYAKAAEHVAAAITHVQGAAPATAALADPDTPASDQQIADALNLVRAQLNAIQTTPRANQKCNQAIGAVAAAVSALTPLGVDDNRTTSAEVQVGAVIAGLRAADTALSQGQDPAHTTAQGHVRVALSGLTG